MKAQRKNYPIIEAICEFRFDPASPWDVALPGLVSARLKPEFPKRKQRRIFAGQLTPGPQGPIQQMTVVDRMQLYTESENALVQVNNHLLSVNVLAPYPSWEEFKPLIEQGLLAYRQVCSPVGVQRVGLRYINRIVIPGTRADLETYFDFRPYVGRNLPQNLTEFACRVVIPYEDRHGSLSLQIRSEAARQDGLPVVLDLDLFTDDPAVATLDNAVDWVDGAHTELDTVFRSSITDRTRDLLGWGEAEANGS
jgi:uncharacterized protein (TIGR04255 family)